MPQKDKKKKDKSKKQKCKEDEGKQRKKQLRQAMQRQRLIKQKQAVIDMMVDPIYASGLADAYKYFLQQLYREGVRFNVYEYAAQKVLRFEKIRKDKAKRIEQLNLTERVVHKEAEI